MEDYEKAYKEALERAKKNYDTAQDLCESSQIGVECFKNTLTNIFPELKESGGEKIRKALIRFHKSTIDVDGIKGDDIIVWLEKQGQTFTKKDVDDAYLKGISDAKHELEKQGEHKPFDSAKTCKDEQSDLINFTEFEKALADVCRGWIGEEIGWKDYIIKNSLPLLEIAKRQLLQQGELIQPVF